MISGFSRAKAWYKILSDLISIGEKRPYSHAYFKYTCPISGIEMVSQASHGFVNEVTYKNFLRDNIVVEEIDLKFTEEESLTVIKWCKSMQGTLYGTDQILSISFLKLFKKSLKTNNSEVKVICSEYVVRGIQKVKIYFGRDVINLDEVTPSDLNKLVKEYIQNEHQ